MQAPFDNIVQHLFHQPSLHSVTVDELENMAAQHPYFAAAHFLLLKKMQDLEHPHFNTQLHKTTLYFNNPLWLHFLLQPDRVANFKVLDKAPFISHDATAPADTPPYTPELAREAPNKTSEINTAAAASHPAEASSPEPHTGIMDVINAIFEEEAIPESSSGINNITANNAGTVMPDAWLPVIDASVASPPAAEGHVLTEINSPVPEEAGSVPAYEAPVPFTSEVSPVVAVMENLDSPVEAAIVHPEEANESMEKPPLPSVIAETIPDSMNVAADPAPLFGAEAEYAEPNGPDNTAEIPEAASGKEDKPLFKPMIETAGAGNDFLFEPYHTVDYFASQGIKLSKMEADSKDKLGRQLRSFTEWLKSMKKLPQVSIDKILSENEESKVVADASHSIAPKEVITEAMAEVFEKQGMADKAVEVYEKLSLQNPAKSAYFAAKIDVLKQ